MLPQNLDINALCRDFARQQGLQAKQRGDELIFSKCPYCGGISREKEKFAINIRTGAFNCMRATCGAKGNLWTLHRDFGLDLGSDVAEYERPKYSWKRFKVTKPFVPTDPAIDYLHNKRGISVEVINRYEIVTKKNDDNVLVFPFYDEDGDVAFIKYRAINFDPDKGGNKEWCESGMKSILFGIKQCVDFQRLIITEGQIDSLSVATAGFNNCCSVPTGKNGMRWIPHNWDWLKKFKEILVFGDFEHDQMTLLPDITSRFMTTETKVLAVRPEDYRGCKDANELLLKFGADAIRDAIKNARPQMLEQVIQLNEVTYQDGDTDEKLPTGIRSIDKTLTGGLPFGLMNILTGKRGEGKSTEGSMLIKQALENGYNCFIYSGEMKKGDVRKWLDLQIAGADRVITEHKGDYDIYKLSPQNIERIGNWYKDQAYIYDTSVVVETQKNLLDVVETYIKQFGCRFVLIDNLMTAIDLEDMGADKFERQELVCKRLARMAQKYNAMILLIAHKKKGNGNDENDDVLGSSEITNLAGIIMSYGRDDNIGENERLLKVTKNRLTGKCDFDGVICGYDDASKRIFEADDTYGASRASKCFPPEDRFMNLPEDEEVPF